MARIQENPTIQLALSVAVLLVIVPLVAFAWQPDREPLDLDPVPEVTSLVLEPGQSVAAPGSSLTLSVKALFADGTGLDVTNGEDGASYTVSDEASVIIDGGGRFHVAEGAPIGQRIEITAIYQDQRATASILILYWLADTVHTNEEGVPVVTNADSITVIVNKERTLPASYEPADLVRPDVAFSSSGDREKHYLRQEAAAALEALFAAAAEDGIELVAVSGYRSFETQARIFEYNVRSNGGDEELANRWSARPGQSEHQTGLAMDVSAESVSCALEADFAEAPEGQWLAANAHRFGFVIRYPQGKEDITGYGYEPWHIRYVGETVAQQLTEAGLTLEEYFTR